MIENLIKDELQSAVSLLFKKHLKASDINVEKPAQKENGDFSSNVSFTLAKELGQNPAEVSAQLAKSLNELPEFESVKSAGPFLNFYLNSDIYRQQLADILKAGDSYGQSDLLKGKKVQVEFISANPTGPFTLANGRGGFSGDVLANVFSWTGAEVQREYYVNDGGNQVKILGDSILSAAGLAEKSDEHYQGEYITEWANDNQKVVAAHKEDAVGLGQIAAAWILDNYNRPASEKVGINFDNWFSERAMIERGEVDEAIKKFGEYGHTYKKDGALWMKTSDFGDDKDRVLVKSDGEKTYFANDVAYHFDKLYKRKFDLVVNFWGADHHGYVNRMLAAVSAMGCPGQLKVVIFQLVKLIKGGQEFRMSKRKGNFITMDDLLTLIGGDDAADVARFFFLSRSFDTHMDFDLDLAKDRSDKNPVFYVKYAHARIHGILAKAENVNSKADLSLIGEPSELELISKLNELPGIVATIATMDDFPVHQLTFYATELAKKFHSFYDKCRVIDDENEPLSAARLELVRATANTLKIVGEKLLGISMPEKM